MSEARELLGGACGVVWSSDGRCRAQVRDLPWSEPWSERPRRTVILPRVRVGSGTARDLRLLCRRSSFVVRLSQEYKYLPPHHGRHLLALANTDLYRYMSQGHDMTMMAVLLGIAAARRGSMHGRRGER